MNIYSVEAEDEAALTEYLESRSCRRAVLARHFDGYTDATSCIATDSILCDQCHESLEAGRSSYEDSVEGGSGNGSGSPESSTEAIHQALRDEIQQDEQLERFHQLLHAHCIYCQLMRVEGEEESHCHQECPHAAAKGCDATVYRRWRSRLELAPRHQCFRCGLSQSICRAIEAETTCVYPHLLLPGLFFLHQVGQLRTYCREVGFRGEEEWQWQWMNQVGEGRFGQQEINWMRVWRRVGEIYLEIQEAKE